MAVKGSKDFVERLRLVGIKACPEGTSRRHRGGLVCTLYINSSVVDYRVRFCSNERELTIVMLGCKGCVVGLQDWFGKGKGEERQRMENARATYDRARSEFQTI